MTATTRRRTAGLVLAGLATATAAPVIATNAPPDVLSHPIRILNEMDISDILEPMEPALSRRVKRTVATIAAVAFSTVPGPATRWLTHQATVQVQHQVDDIVAKFTPRAGSSPP